MTPALSEYLYRVRPTRPALLAEGATAQEQAAISEHVAYLKDLTERGLVILAGRTLTSDETSFGIVIFRARSRDAARAIMQDDPAVRKGVMQAELFLFRVALMGTRSVP